MLSGPFTTGFAPLRFVAAAPAVLSAFRLGLGIPCTLVELAPQLVEDLAQGCIVELAGTASGEDDCIQWKQLVLAQAKRFPGNALYAVAISSVADVLFGNDEAEPGMLQLVGAGEDQELGLRGANRRRIKNGAILRRIEQPQRLGECEVAAWALHSDSVASIRLLARRQS